MSPIPSLIVDDEPLARERIRQLLAAHSDFSVVGECGSGSEALLSVAKLEPRLMFLDVQMPEMDGFQLLDALDHETAPSVVFTTAYDHYAVRAFDSHAVDYLLKPVDRERFETALERARSAVDAGAGLTDERIMALIEAHRARTLAPRRFAIRDNGSIRFLRAADVGWVEASGNYVRLHTDSESHQMRATISGVERRLDPELFVRVHRSFIVNLDWVQEIQPWFHGEHVVILQNGARVNVGRRYREQIFSYVEAMS